MWKTAAHLSVILSFNWSHSYSLYALSDADAAIDGARISFLRMSFFALIWLRIISFLTLPNACHCR